MRWIEEDPFGPSLYPSTAPQAPMTAGPSLIIASPSLIAHRHQFGQMLVLFERIHFKFRQFLISIGTFSSIQIFGYSI